MAGAKRQRQARPILCEREAEVTETFAAVGVLYRSRPTALHRRFVGFIGGNPFPAHRSTRESHILAGGLLGLKPKLMDDNAKDCRDGRNVV